MNFDPSEHDCLAACAMTDAEGYTGVAEALPPPELVGLVNRYFRALFRAVLGNGGLVLDVKGDGILAIWTSGTPGAVLRTQVCRSCLQMVEASDRFNMCFPARRLPTRIGVDFGPVALATCGGTRDLEPDPPLLLPDSVVPPAAPLSTISVPLDIPVGVLADLLEDAVPRSLGTSDSMRTIPRDGRTRATRPPRRPGRSDRPAPGRPVSRRQSGTHGPVERGSRLSPRSPRQERRARPS